MKKLILSLALMGTICSAVYGQNFSTTIVVQPNSITNVLLGTMPTNGAFVLQSVTVTANGSTNVNVSFIDTPNGTLTNVVPAYTNTISYATNYNTTWTNFYGVIQTNPIPIIALIDATNNVVAAVTNQRPIVLSCAALMGTSTVINNGRYNFYNGIYATNAALAGGSAAITVVYSPK